VHENIAFLLTSVVCLGIAAQWLAWWAKLPSILFLLLFGLIAGPVSGYLQPDELMGDLLFPIVSLGIAIILFEGALTLRFRDIREHGTVVTNLVTWGALINWLLISLGCWYFAEFSPSLALLFGALVVVTGPTVVMPLLRNVRPVPAVGKVLHWEGILIDPIGAILAVLVFEVIASEARGGSFILLLKELMAGGGFGIAGGIIMSFLLRKHLIPEYLHDAVTLSAVVAVFTLSNGLAHESGLLAVTVMGVWLANAKGLDMADILSFKESLSLLVVSVLFILLAARLELEQITTLGPQAIAILLVILLARPVMVFMATIKSGMSWQEKTLISWIAPRGIVAAAVSSIFAIKLDELGVEGADTLAGLTFLVILVTVVLQSISAAPMAKWLGVAEEESRGILILGGNTVGIAIGKALNELGFRVKLASTNWQEIQTARMEGLDTYYGNPVSAHADRHLDLLGIGRLFAMSRRPALNTLACIKYRGEFGRQKVFTLRTSEEKDGSDKRRIAETYQTPRLFGDDITVQKLASLIGQGAEIKSTQITNNFTFEDYQQQHGANGVPLFIVDPKNRLRAFTDQETLKVEAGWTLVALLPQQAENQKKNGDGAELP